MEALPEVESEEDATLTDDEEKKGFREMESRLNNIRISPELPHM